MFQTKKQRLILAEFPVSPTGRIIFNALVRSKQHGLKKAAKEFGPFEDIIVAEMPGVKTKDGKRYMIFYGEQQKMLLAKWLEDEMRRQKMH